MFIGNPDRGVNGLNIVAYYAQNGIINLPNLKKEASHTYVATINLMTGGRMQLPFRLNTISVSEL